MSPGDLAILARLPTEGAGRPRREQDRLAKDKATLLPFLKAAARRTVRRGRSALGEEGGRHRTRSLEALAPLLPGAPMLFDDETLSDRPTCASSSPSSCGSRSCEDSRGGTARRRRGRRALRTSEREGMPHIEVAVHVDKRVAQEDRHRRTGARCSRRSARRARAQVEQPAGSHRCTSSCWVRVDPGWNESPAKLARARLRRARIRHDEASSRRRPGAPARRRRAARPSSRSSGARTSASSTLFNRLARSKLAIVHDEPGVTRDRHYADTQRVRPALHAGRHRRLRSRDDDPMKAGHRAAT